MIVLHIHEKSNIDILPLWINFYQNNNISFIIHTKLQLDIDIKLYSSNDEYLNKEKHIVVTEYDYLFSYKKGENDVMLLSNDITGIENEKSIIGKVFYVPVQDKKEYTTFEIPDFIIYKHDNHTNYTKDGIIINNGNIPSNNFVCFSLKLSKVAMETEYYENNILFDISNPDNVYIEYEYNIFVNKEKKYGIIWHYKCACSTITNYFGKINNLNKITHGLVIDNLKYRYNNYLQGFDIISFVRHPFFRFISCYFNKHINKLDNYYHLENETYLNYLNIYKDDTLFNFADYLQNGNIIDDHSICISKMNYFNKYKNLNYNIVHIEDINLNKYLFNFFSKYHVIEKLKIFIGVSHFDTSIININKEYKFYNYNDWKKYLEINNIIPNYLSILDDEFIQKLNIIYNDDLVLLNYENKLLKNTNVNNNINNDLPYDFDLNMYKELNFDLSSLTNNLKAHYLQFGKNEERLYKIENLPDDFDVSVYKELNSDLFTLTDNQAKAHYIQYGKNEGKLYKIENLPDDFDVSVYKEINYGLNTLTDNQAKAHYVQYGKDEGKLYKIENLPDDFDVSVYKELNFDLSTLTDNQAKSHYIQYGKNEGKDYSNLLINNKLNLFYNPNINIKNFKNIKILYEEYNDFNKYLSILNNKTSIYSYDRMINYYSNIIKFVIDNNIIDDENFIKNLYTSYPIEQYLILKIYDLKQKSSNQSFLNTEILKVYDTYLKKNIYVIYPFLNYPIFEHTRLNVKLKNKIKVWDYNIINLKHRTDNLNQCMNNINDIKWLNPIRFEAIHHKIGYIGCILSHISILKKYKNTNKNVLIVEDDNLIIDKNKLNSILNILDENIFDWDIYLGSVGNLNIQLKKVIYVNDIEFLNVVNFTKANFVYYNKKCVENILLYEEQYNLLFSQLKYYDRFLNLFNVFTSYNICNVNNSFSEIEKFSNTKEKDEIIYTYNFLKEYVNNNNIFNNIMNNIKELIQNFDVNMYKELNPDLFLLTDIEAIKHYIEYGYDENRLYKIENIPDDFDVNMYKELNPDLKILSNNQAITHYIQFGYNEGKIYKIENIPDDFDVNMYKELNTDLKNLTDNQAKAHYIQYGKNEGKIYKIENLPDDFDVSVYKEINPDLKNLTNNQAKAHYIKYGIFEKRIYKYNIIIQTTAKDEDIIICEWIVHNILLGVDHIYIYDDNSIIPITTTIQILPEWIKNKVTVFRLEFDFYNETEIKNTEYWEFYKKEKYWSNLKQHFLINYFINKYNNISKWCLFIDVDEFIYLKTYTNMNEFMKNYENEPGLYLQWLLYGTSYHIDINDKTLIMDNNLYHSNNYHPTGKSIIKMKEFNNKYIYDIHTLINKDKLYYFDKHAKPFELSIHLAHYHKINVKTFLKRKLRKEIGYKDGNITDVIKLLSLLTFDNDTYNEINPMNKYIIEINKILNKEFYFPLDYSCIDKQNNIIEKYFNEKNNLCSLVIYNNNDIITSILPYCNKITYKMLEDIIHSDNVKYSTYKNLYCNILPYDFNINMYKELNPDLNHFNFNENNQLINNYLQFGKNEGRLYKIDNLPYDFDINMYKEFNYGLEKLTDNQAKAHYLRYGKNEERVYKIENLPDDFDINMYKEINTELKSLTDNQAKLHYVQYGISENKLYKIDNLPDDFNVNMYKELNYGLDILTDIETKSHYIKYGKKEGKLYKIENLPDDFDVNIYKKLNPDLETLNDNQLKLHYSQHGYKEDRNYKDIHFNKEHFCKINNYIGNNPYKKYIEDIRQEKNSYFKEQINSIIIPNKNSILLVNHDNKLYGANHYMYSLFLFLKDKYKDTINIFLCEINYNSSLYDKYSIKKEDVFEYQHDPTLLYMLYQKIQPKVFYLNSCNYAIYQVYKYIPENRRILHSHEIFTHYLLSKKVMPDYVVSEVISNQYVQLYKKQPKIQPPFITNIDNILELSKEFVEPIYNNYNTLDTNKITIGMCGQITERKNYKLFIEMSLHFSFYNFIWIGDSSPVFDEYKNIYHIKSTHNPYKYFKQIIDHFILFSLEDPCPYVILENILLESNIITFKNNIYYHHTHENLKNMFINYDGSISKKTCVDAIYKYVNCKKKNNKKNGYNYIKTYFNKPSQVEDKIDELLNY